MLSEWIEATYAPLLLGVVQGVGEFLPISSSAHVFVMERLLGISTGERTLEIALHMGTLLTVLLYFRRAFLSMALSVIRWILSLAGSSQGSPATPHPWASTALNLCLATIPAVLAGMILQRLPSSLTLVGNMSILSALILYWADKRPCRSVEPTSIPLKHALLIGLWQTLALLPGASRLGMTLAGARLLGYNRPTSLIYSYWLSVPVTVGAITLEAFKVLTRHGDGGAALTMPSWESLLLGIVVAMSVGLLVIRWLLNWLERHSFTPFILYRLIFGTVLTWWGLMG